MTTDLTTVKKLYGFSHNECAHPKCNQVLVEIDQKTGRAVNYGELAHIHGQKPGTERFLQEIYDNKNELHGFDNILILCARHHHQVDQLGQENSTPQTCCVNGKCNISSLSPRPN